MERERRRPQRPRPEHRPRLEHRPNRPRPQHRPTPRDRADIKPLCGPSCCKILPVIIAIALCFWSYYVYIVEFCFPVVDHRVLKIVYIVVYNILFGLMMWSFFATMCTKISKVSHPFKLPLQAIEHARNAKTEQCLEEVLAQYCQQNNIRLWTRTDQGYIR